MKKKRTITFSLHALFFQKNAIFSCKQSNHRAHLANLIKNKAVNRISYTFHSILSYNARVFQLMKLKTIFHYYKLTIHHCDSLVNKLESSTAI